MRALLACCCLSLCLAPAALAQNLTITGRFQYQSRDYDINGFRSTSTARPVRNADVAVYGSQGTVAATYTNQGGYFSVTVPSPTLPEQLYVRCTTSSAYASAAQPNSVVPLFVRSTTLGLPLYSLGNTTAFLVPSGATALAVGTLTASTVNTTHPSGLTSIGNAFEIFDVFVGTYEYLVNYTGAPIPVPAPVQKPIYAYWPTGAGNSVATYAPLNGTSFPQYATAYISWHQGSDAALLAHECGHFVYDEHALDHSPRGPHIWGDSNQEPTLAWNEGFATFFGCKAIAWLGYPDDLYMDALPNWTNTGWLLLSAQLSTSFPYAVPTSALAHAFGDADEAAIVSALWNTTLYIQGPGYVVRSITDAMVAGMGAGTANPNYAMTVVDLWESFRSLFAISPPFLEHARTSFANFGVRFSNDTFEGNDTAADAWPIVPATAWMEDLTLYADQGGEPFDRDWFRFDLRMGQTVVAETRYWMPMADAETMFMGFPGVYRPNGSPAGTLQQTVGRNYRITYTAQETGTHRLLVDTQPAGLAARRRGSYDLQIRTLGFAGAIPRLSAPAPVRIGTTAELQLESTGSTYLLFLDGLPLYNGVDYGLGTLWNLDVSTMFLLAQGAVTGNPTTIPIPVPNDPVLIGVSVFLQGGVFPASNQPPRGTNLLRVVIQA